MGKRKRFKLNERGIYQLIDEYGVICGIYRIYLNKKIPYPKNSSNLLYIGRSGDVNNGIPGRLQHHLNGTRGANRIVYGYVMSNKTCSFDFISTTPKNSERKEKEELRKFKRKYGVYPVANNQAPAKIKRAAYKRVKSVWTPKREKRIIQLFRERKSLPEIQRTMRLTDGQVRGKIYQLQKLGILKWRTESKTKSHNKVAKRSVVRSVWTPKLENRLKSLWRQRKTVSEIVKILKLRDGQIRGKIYQLQTKGVLKWRTK